MLLLLISFIAGILTVLAPCILPLLPIVVGGSIGGGKDIKRAITVTASLALSVILFTLLVKASTLLVSIPQDFWKWFSGGIIILFGLISVFPATWEKLPFLSGLNSGSNKILTAGYQKKSFWGDVIIGGALGPVFSTCSPTYFLVLAAVLPESFGLGILYLLAYSIGLSLALLFIAFVGQKILTKVGIVANPHGTFKRILGVVFIIVGIAIVTGIDKEVQTKILDSGFFDITQVEQKLLQKLDSTESDSTTLPNQSKKNTYPTAPELVSPNGYINTGGKEIHLADYVGKKVVLLDFWTYSCINCKRTLPYLTSWYETYRDDGLIIIGVHTPEFSFEKVQENVERAVQEEGITYPVVLDNEYKTWNAFNNHYWPRKYLIDINGLIVYDHIGEGDYDETEEAIRKALEERAEYLGIEGLPSSKRSEPTDPVRVEGKIQSPEIYFGSSRNTFLGNGQAQGTDQTFTIPTTQDKNKLYLGGMWSFLPEYAIGTKGGEVVFRYDAKNVYMVAQGSQGTVIEIFKDGESEGLLTIQEEKLYPLIHGDNYGQHTLHIEIKSGTLNAFTFTFG